MDPILTTIVAALIAAIGTMWKKLTAEHARLSARYDECERDRNAIRQELEAVKTDVALFKSCPSEPCGARAAFHRAQSFMEKG
jgi:outer membrane murein-binding lipoprotein Lpp